MFIIGDIAAQNINKIEPLFWWTGMKNPELQLMVYGDHISEYHPIISDPHVCLKNYVTVESPNYQILYLDLSKAQPGFFDITFVKENCVFL